MNSEVTVKVNLDGLDEVAQKAVDLSEKMKEARTLAGELASMLERLEVKVEV